MKQVTFTKSEMETYEKVATIIGSVMDGAYKDIIRKLASGDANRIRVAGFEDGVDVTNDDLAVFFSIARSSGIDLLFSPVSVRPIIGNSFATTAIPVDTTRLKDARIRGEISIGGTIRI